MINPRTETVRTLAQVAAEYPFPPGRGKTRRNVSCLYRWTMQGCRGIVLQSIELGGVRCTSDEALARFFEALSAKASAKVFRRRSTHRQQRTMERANARLRAAGL